MLPSATAPLGCGDVVDLDDELHHEDRPEPPPVAGQMSDAAANAKRAFDAQRWDAARRLLEGVASGKTGDDTGNRQIAEYHLAIALFRLGDQNAAQDLFIGISERVNHLKFNEALLWLAKQATGDCVTLRGLRALANYRAPSPRRTEDPDRTILLLRLRFARARGLVTLGRGDEARREFAALSGEPDVGEHARECLQALRTGGL